MKPEMQTLEWLRYHAGLLSRPPLASHASAKRVTDQFRPYAGQVDSGILREVSELARAVEAESLVDPTIGVPAALALWMLSDTVERWALDAGGMLQRNSLISTSDSAIIREWVVEIHDIGCRLLENHPHAQR